MRRILAVLSVWALCWGAQASFAEENQEKKILLLIPLEMKGDYRPISSEALADLLKQKIEKAAPLVQVVVAPAKSYLDETEAARLGRDAGAELVFYGDVRFRKEVKVASMTGAQGEGYPTGGAIPAGFSMRYVVTVAGVAHGYLVESESAKVIADEPALLFESEMTGAVKDSPAMQAVETKLADNCVHEISESLIKHVKASAKRNR